MRSRAERRWLAAKSFYLRQLGCQLPLHITPICAIGSISGTILRQLLRKYPGLGGAGIPHQPLCAHPSTGLSRGSRLFIKYVCRVKANPLQNASGKRNITSPKGLQHSESAGASAERAFPNSSIDTVPVTALITAVINDSIGGERTNSTGHHRNQNPTNREFHNVDDLVSPNVPKLNHGHGQPGSKCYDNNRISFLVQIS